ncbi:PAS domain-containing sensor histidine kinase [Ramlibacter henchirensis]|uniref:PAS domain-containing sensor histidine kinase n=1 Tax=Ramlibacter henchirensis TaxID=204072 RepID=UPI001F0DBF30|nr:PAS domain-containing sensor histidine kinase [Ramlibacter henchirensis]
MPGGAALPAELQRALDEAPCGLLRTDAQGTILRVNLTFCRWVGYEREELLGRKLQDLLTVGARIFHLTHLAPLMQMQGSVSEVKLEIVPRSGSAIPMVLNAQRHETPQGAYSELALFVARDRDKYERELLAARSRLEQLLAEGRKRQDEDRERAQIAEQMVGIVSHDLRNPLQTIQMGVLLLTRGGVSPHQLNVLGRVSRAAERSHRLIADLLDFTQARLGRGIAVHPAPIALHQAIADALDELGQAFPGRELVHEAEGEGECAADPDRIAQLLGNLVGNAMAYGQADAPVRVRSVIGPRAFELSVHNRGAPIPPSLQAHLFEPLVRGTAASGATRSVGLGLFIVGEIAKAHGGRVAVTSSEEQGTTFTASFPRGS